MFQKKRVETAVDNKPVFVDLGTVFKKEENTRNIRIISPTAEKGVQYVENNALPGVVLILDLSSFVGNPKLFVEEVRTKLKARGFKFYLVNSTTILVAQSNYVVQRSNTKK